MYKITTETTEQSTLSLLFLLRNYLHWRIIHSQPHKNTHLKVQLHVQFNHNPSKHPVICDFTDNETFLAQNEVHGFH